MKKAAVLIYDQFCNFEISVILEIFAMHGKAITVFAKGRKAVKSEEGLTVLPDKTIHEVRVEDFDCLILPGALDIRETIGDGEILDFIRQFNVPQITIAAISIAPILLVKAGVMGKRRFMAGVNAEDLYEEGFPPEQLAGMKGWDENLQNPNPDGFIISGNIITSVAYDYVRWSLALGRMMGMEVSPATFGL